MRDDFSQNQHDAATRSSLHKIAVALAHLWVTACYLKNGRLPDWSEYYIYSQQLEWGDRFLNEKRKRIKVRIEIEEF